MDYTKFQVSVYGNLESFSSTLSKARVRIFYKGANRNASFITDEVGEKLVQTLAYAPVKGIYDEELGDFTTHGTSSSQGKAYGFVPSPANFAWEDHLDEDGVMRTYATADVVLWTSVYPEAKNIVGKPQSMELYGPSIKGKWDLYEGSRYYHFEDAAFLGLQVLGDDVEPAFEGASFFSLFESFTKAVEAMDKAQQSVQNYRLSDEEKNEKLYALLNSSSDENSYNYVVAVYDDYALIRNRPSGNFYRAYYLADDRNEVVEVTQLERVYLLDITEAEYNALEALRALNGGTFMNLEEKVEIVEEVTAEFAEEVVEETVEQPVQENIAEIFENVPENEESLIQEPTTSVEASEPSAFSAEEVADMQAELESLRAFKGAVELEQKQALVEKYRAIVDTDSLVAVENAIDTYSFEELEKELAYLHVKNSPNLFTAVPTAPRVPKDYTPKEGIDAILSKYKK